MGEGRFFPPRRNHDIQAEKVLSRQVLSNNLKGSKELITCTMLEDALRSRYNVQVGGEKGGAILQIAFFVSGPEAGRGGGRGGPIEPPGRPALLVLWPLRS